MGAFQDMCMMTSNVLPLEIYHLLATIETNAIMTYNIIQLYIPLSTHNSINNRDHEGFRVLVKNRN